MPECVCMCVCASVYLWELVLSCPTDQMQVIRLGSKWLYSLSQLTGSVVQLFHVDSGDFHQGAHAHNASALWTELLPWPRSQFLMAQVCSLIPEECDGVFESSSNHAIEVSKARDHMRLPPEVSPAMWWSPANQCHWLMLAQLDRDCLRLGSINTQTQKSRFQISTLETWKRSCWDN